MKSSRVIIAAFCVVSLMLSPIVVAQRTNAGHNYSEWISIDISKGTNAGSFFDNHKNETGLGTNDRMNLINSSVDKWGNIHERYRQLYNNVPVEAGEIILHSRDNAVSCANGLIVQNLQLNTTPAISLDQAKSIIDAQLNLSARNGCYRDDGANHLVITVKDYNGDYSAANQTLAYKFTISLDHPFDLVDAYIDANTGAILRQISKIDRYSTGSAVTKYDGTQTIRTLYRPDSSDYILMDDSRGGGLHVRDYDNNSSEYKHNTNTWDTSSSIGTSCLWAIEKIYDFYHDSLNWNSYSNHGERIICKTTTDAYTYGATFHLNPQVDTFIFVSKNKYHTNKPCVVLDIIGHEYEHGVAITTSREGHVNEECDALSEGFPDIMGCAVELFARGTYGNYQMGKDCSTDSIYGDRDLSYPKNTGGPDAYKGKNWSTDPHVNGEILGYWYYLLSEGSGLGTHYIDDTVSNPVYTIEGIGHRKAENIAFNARTFYLPATGKFWDARKYTLFIADSMYGHGSNELIQTANAWFAVNLRTSTPPIIDSITTSKTIVSRNDSAEIVCWIPRDSLGGITYTWSDNGNHQHYSLSSSWNRVWLKNTSTFGTNDTLTVTCVASNPNGSDTSAITVIVVHIPSPTLLSPSNNNTAVPLSTTFKWQPVEGANGYKFQLSQSYNFSSLYYATVLTADSVQISNLPTTTMFYWHVASRIADSTYGPFSSSWSFHTVGIDLSDAYSRDSYGHPKLMWNSYGTVGPYDIYRADCEARFNCDAYVKIDSGISASPYIDLSVVVFPKIPVADWTLRYYVANDSFVSGYSVYYNYEFDDPKSHPFPVPKQTLLVDAYPNPFNPQTTVEYQLSEPGYVSLIVYNTIGQEIEKLSDKDMQAGYYIAKWDGSNEASGLYFIRFNVIYASGKPGYSSVKKLLLLK